MIQTRRSGSVLTVELDRDHKRNALTAAMCVDLEGIFTDVTQGLEQPDPVRCIVLTGKGSAFCAGADLSGPAYEPEFTPALLSMLYTYDRLPVPVIAAVNGPAVGAGVQLAIGADLRVVADSAVFAIPVAKLGLALDNWTIKRLAAIIGGGHARSVFYGSEPIDADKAERIGLANRRGSAEVAYQWAVEVAALAPLTVRHLKAVLNDDDARRPATTDQDQLQIRCWSSSDAQAGRQARFTGVAPEFHGQ